MAHLTLEGLLDGPPRPGDEHSTTARLVLRARPSGEHTTRWPVTCHITDPVIAHTVLTDLTPGTALRAFGYLHEHEHLSPGDEPVLAVTRLEVLADHPLPHRQDAPDVDADGIPRQRGAYIPSAELRLKEIAALISRQQNTLTQDESLSREILNLLTRPVYCVPPSRWCPRCHIADVEDYNLPIPHTDDTAPCARCRRCNHTWALDPAANGTCPICGGSGSTGNQHYRDPRCPCTDGYVAATN
ncbi:hypothetical protein OG422_31325 (plasmid) [Streptomyces sp. NBC_01525]|uniref:hypothetical protein n=1 Tax=Streptomyces sp. NBC_01525 TaxID=2903893 RepID=UPI002F917437